MRIVKTLDAERDLAEIFDYIARDRGLGRAEIVLRQIEKTLENLSAWPGSGRVRADLAGAPRVFSIWPWLIIYEPQPLSDGILVWRILDGRRDISTTVNYPPRR